MAKKWQDPLDVEPPKYTLVEVLGIPNAERKKSEIQFKEWRIAAFMDDEGEWRLPEIEMGDWKRLGRVFYNEVYRWRDLIP